VSTADWVVLGVVAVCALYGFVTGFLRGALSLAGFALGAYLGARAAPQLLGDASAYVPVVTLAGALVGGALMRGVAELVARILRTSIGVIPGLRFLDSLAGLVFGFGAGVLLCWAVGAVLLYLPGQSDLRRSVQRSTILANLNDQFPPERVLEQLERVDPLGVFLGPPAIVPKPDAAIVRDPDVVEASRSVVRITGIACGLGVEGSGWVARRGVAVTSAHVVAGVSRPRVDLPGGEAYVSTVVHFDATNDLAILRIPGLRARPLALADSDRGTAVALVGYPENGPLSRTPGRLGGTRPILSRDAYGEGPLRREVTTIRGLVRPGSSGGPGIDGDGRVRTTVFARRAGERGGYGVPAGIVRDALREAGPRPVPSTECTG
jgi:S1-C subfamily serine protease